MGDLRRAAGVFFEAMAPTSEIAIISDIHGNAFALELVLSDIAERGIGKTICLGDAVQGGPQPVECVRLLREFGCPVVMGNADDFLLYGTDSGAEPLTAGHVQVRNWQLSQLDGEDIQFMKGFSPTVEAVAGEFKILCFHGSPTDFDQVILPETADEELRKVLGDQPATFCFGGHTHVQQFRRIDTAFYVNPGSVGFAYSHHQDESDFKADPWAEYAVLRVEGRKFDLAFRRIPYDAAKMREIYLQSDRPNKEAAARQYEPR